MLEEGCGASWPNPAVGGLSEHYPPWDLMTTLERSGQPSLLGKLRLRIHAVEAGGPPVLPPPPSAAVGLGVSLTCWGSGLAAYNGDGVRRPLRNDVIDRRR
jgi:hypothetical protein